VMEVVDENSRCSWGALGGVKMHRSTCPHSFSYIEFSPPLCLAIYNIHTPFPSFSRMADAPSASYYTMRSMPPCTPDYVDVLSLLQQTAPSCQTSLIQYSTSNKNEVHRSGGSVQPPRRSSFALSDILEDTDLDAVIDESLMNLNSLPSEIQTVGSEDKKNSGFLVQASRFISTLRKKCHRVSMRTRAVKLHIRSKFSLDPHAEV